MSQKEKGMLAHHNVTYTFMIFENPVVFFPVRPSSILGILNVSVTDLNGASTELITVL